MSRPLKIIGGIAALGLLAAGAGWAWIRYAPRPTPQGQPPLAELSASSLGAFREAFNARASETRILALLSPT